jgi:hypothetical protein
MTGDRTTRAAPLVCPVHGPLEPGWTTCPYCERETRSGSGQRAGATRNQSVPQRPRTLSQAGTQRHSEHVPRGGAGRANETVVRRAHGQRGRGRGRAAPTEQLQRPPRLLAWLIMKEGARVGHVFQLDAEGTEIGRDADNHIVVDDPKVSAFHCKVVVEEDKRFMVWDLASANGTLVNGERVTAPVAIQENDVITLGTTSLVLKTLE